MKRTQVYLPDELHEKLRRISYEQRKSMAQVVREAVSAYVGGAQAGAPAAGDGYGDVKIIAEPEALSEEDLTPEQLEQLKQNPLYHIIGIVSPSHLSDLSEHRDD